MNDIFSEKLDDITCKIESIRKSIALVAEFEGRLLSFKQTAGRISEEVKDIRKDYEDRLRKLEREDSVKALIFGCIVGASGFMTGVLITVLYF